MWVQHFLINSLLNPSGPGDLSLGRCFTIASISEEVKGSSRQSRPSWAWIREGRSNNISLKSDCPILCLKDCQIRSSLSAWEQIVSPLSFLRLAIEFLLCLMVAFAWKFFVPASPRVAHFMAPSVSNRFSVAQGEREAFLLRWTWSSIPLNLNLCAPLKFPGVVELRWHSQYRTLGWKD